MVKRILPSQRGFTREILSILIAGMITVAVLYVAPAEWFLKIHSIQVIQSDEGKTIVIQARTVWPGDALSVQWNAQVDRIVLDPAGKAFGATVCAGEGFATIRDDVYEVVRMPLADWVGDPFCNPDIGEPHVAQASWSFDILGVTKTASTRSAAFTLVDRTIRLDR
ncbi:hypothetical protein [Rubrimonas sp.]|uniref:hypothetical protein n=1 Tax=Rubrimonas sp. TaxID=2036015 RepID=UPI002FDCFBCB